MYDIDHITDRRGTYAEKWDIKDGELPMWVADMDIETAPCVRAAIERRASHGIYGYTYVPDEWYDAYIGWWKERHGLIFGREHMIYSSGVVAVLSSVVRKLTSPGEKVLLLTPCYNIFYNSIVNNGRFVQECELVYSGGEYSIDFDTLEMCMSDPQTSMMFLCNPQNPTGNIWDRDTLARIGRMAYDHGVIVVSDEAHCDLTAPGKEYVPFASVDDTNRSIGITCLSAGKTFNIAGLQTAAVVVYDDVLRHRVWRGLNTDECGEPNAFAVDAVIAAFTEGGGWLDALREHIHCNRQRAEGYISREIPRAHAVRSDATYLLWTDLRYSGLSEPAADIRQKTGLFLSEGRIYGKGGEGFVRMNLACPSAYLEDGLERLKKWDRSLTV
ncbi:MAG: pyridoxal phosphate-dependent aminotransferase [Oscillospiraceae bacterium]|nr:pyridoxal phosphate-dependent aminotransferase [Oscillospiraceae bacterium]